MTSELLLSLDVDSTENPVLAALLHDWDTRGADPLATRALTLVTDEAVAS